MNQSDLIKLDPELEAFLANKRNGDLFKITLEQLRVLYFLGGYGSISQVAKHIGRDQSSTTKSLKSLEDHSSRVLLSRLRKPNAARGTDPLTPAGVATHHFGAEVLSALRRFAEDFTPDARFVVKVGLTTFLLNFVHTLIPLLHAQRRHFESRLVHLRTGQLEDAVLNGSVHCAFGGKTMRKVAEPTFKAGLDARVIRSDDFGFMVNYDLPIDVLSIENILSERIPLILPTSGIVFDFICEYLGVDTPTKIESMINVVEWCDDVHFAFEIMRLKLHMAGMFALQGIYHDHFKRFYDPECVGSFRTRYYTLPDIDHNIAIVFLTNKELVASISKDHPVGRCISFIANWIDSIK